MSELVGGKSVQQRVALCGKLIELRKKLAITSPDHRAKAKIMVTRRMQAVRRILTGSGNPSLSDEMLTPGAASVRLLSDLEALNGAPQAQRVAFAYRAKSILESMKALEIAERFGAAPTYDPAVSMDEMEAASKLKGQLSSILSGDLVDADALVDESAVRGKFRSNFHAELADAKQASNKVWTQLSSFEAMLVEGFDKIEAEYNRLRFAQKKAAYFGESEKYKQVSEEFDVFVRDVYLKADEAKKKKLRLAQEQEHGALAQVGKKLIAEVLDASTVSADDASKWSASQEITKQAVARLKKLGYPVEKVRSDMAEFYRLTGGRVAAVKISTNGSMRANATDIGAHGKPGTINLGSSFDKRVLWHELAHHMEADPVAKASAGRYIRRRSGDKGVRSLQALTGNMGYKSDEKALVANFFSPYVGKIYDDGATEVFSMGVESFSDPVLLAKRAMDDPQTLEFVSGFIRAPIDPIEKTGQELRLALIEMSVDAAGADDDYIVRRIAEIASAVRFEPSSDTGWAEKRGITHFIREFNMVGNVTEPKTGLVYHVLSGLVRRWASRRKVSGYTLIEQSDQYMGTRGITVATKDKNTMLAIVALHQNDGYFRQPEDLQDAAYLRKIAP